MKTNHKMHRKIFFIVLSILLLLLVALSVGTTYGKYSIKLERLTFKEPVEIPLTEFNGS